MKKFVFFIAVFLLSFSERGQAQQPSQCGNPPLVCVAMFGLSQFNAPERKLVDKLYNAMVDNADNSRSKLFNNSLATAVKEVVKKADDQTIQFWVLIINPTDQKQTATFNVYRSDKIVANAMGVAGLFLNCNLSSSLCPPNQSDTDSFELVWSDIALNGQLVSQFKAEVEPVSVVARGYHVGVPNDADESDRYSIAFSGGEASDRIKPDKRDLLRLGLVNGAGKTPDFGEVERGPGGCAVYATFNGTVDVTTESEKSSIFFKEDKRKFCHEWIVLTNSLCEGEYTFKYRETKSGNTEVNDGEIIGGKRKKFCGAKNVFFKK